MSTQAEINTVAPQEREMVKALGLTSATTLVMGSMIGSGIFIVSADIARITASPALLIAAWTLTGFMTVIAALSYGELAAMMPKAGGQYVFLRESLGPLWGFLYGWTLFLVIQTGTIAAVGVAFGKFLGYFFPSVSSTHWVLHIVKVPPIHIGPMLLGNWDVGLNTQNLAGIVTIVGLTVINIFGVKLGALVQNIFTFAKVAGLLGVIAAGVFVGRNASVIAENFGHFWVNAGLSVKHVITVSTNPDGSLVTAMVGSLVIVAVAQTGSLFSADAWNNVTFAAAEVKNPKRNLPLALALGAGGVIILYIAINLIYLTVLPLFGQADATTVLGRGIQYATEDRVGTAAMMEMFGAVGGALMAIAVLLSSFGCSNGLILSGARVYYAMARDNVFFAKSAGNLHPKYKTPAMALIIQAIWTCVLCLSGSYNQLLDYIIFAVLVFYILTIFGLFVLRRTRPNAERPYKAIGYPVLPAIYILLAVFVDIVLLRYKPQYTWPGLIIVLLGIPVYYLVHHGGQKAAAGKA